MKEKSLIRKVRYIVEIYLKRIDLKLARILRTY